MTEIVREVVSQVPNWLVVVLVVSFVVTVAAAILMTVWLLAPRLKRIKSGPFVVDFEGVARPPDGPPQAAHSVAKKACPIVKAGAKSHHVSRPAARPASYNDSTAV